jgi:hypothetical protein
VTVQNDQTQNDGSPVTHPPTQASLFDDDVTWFEEEAMLEDLLADDGLGLDDLTELLGYAEVPLLIVDTDPERAVMRQKEMMDTVFGGIGEEKKAEKRMGLAMQQLDIEQRHALRLLLVYQDPADLVAHLTRCLAEPAYGYGERGSGGRTIAQAMADLAEEEELADIATAWLETHRDFQQRVLSGTPISFRSLFDYADLDSFQPLLQRVGDLTWRLGVEDEGKYRDFQGSIEQVWPDICDTYVAWCEADNEAWLADLKKKAARLPDTILRAARADRLRKEQGAIEVKDNQVTLVTTRDGQDWPRLITLANDQGVGQLGLSRLSGHSFYELAWEGGLHVRRFEISGTTRNKVPFEHIEMATLLAEALGAEHGLQPELVTPETVEAAYLRRMKVTEARLGPPEQTQLPKGVQGKPAAMYQVGDVVVTMIVGGEDFAYVTAAGKADEALLLRRSEKRGVMLTLLVSRGRIRQGSPLMTTPLAELGDTPAWRRAVCAWGAWLIWALK